MRNTRTCPKCRGMMYQEPGEYEPDWACLNCGKRINLKDMEAIMSERMEAPADIKEQVDDALSIKEHQVASQSTKEHLDIGSLTREQKAEIAREAQDKGVKETAEAYGIPWAKVRAWIGAYCRKPKAERLIDAVNPKEKVAKQEPEKSLPATKVNKSKPSATKVNKGEPKCTKVDKGDRYIYLGTFTVVAADELPPLPEFDSAWPMLTQIEWLQTYKELARR